jgi:hypothetical protein
MNEEEKTEINREDGKPEDTGQAHRAAQLVDDETSNVNEEAHQTSYISTSEIPKLFKKK